MANPEIGPFGKVSLTQNAALFPSPVGDVIITTGDDITPGAVYSLGVDGKIKINGVEFTGGGSGGGVSEQDLADAISAAVDGLASTDYVDQKVQQSAGSGGSVSVPAWTAATLLNSFRQMPDAPSVKNEPVAFRKVGHRVELTGIIQLDTSFRPGEAAVLFQLPAACRPAQFQKILPVAMGGTAGTIKVLPSGNVVLMSGPAVSYVSLHGVSFTLD